MPLLEVELVEERLTIKEVIEGLCTHLEQARTTSQKASSQPGGNPACGRCSISTCTAHGKSDQIFFIVSTKRAKLQTIFLMFIKLGF